MRKKPLLWIEWEDIATYSSWREEGKADDVRPALCRSVGWKIKASKGKLVIAATRNYLGECADRTIIPKANIKSIRRLE